MERPRDQVCWLHLLRVSHAHGISYWHAVAHARTRSLVRHLTFVVVGMRNVGQDIVNASRGNKSDFEVAREIIGGGNGRKASNAEIASVILSGPSD